MFWKSCHTVCMWTVRDIPGGRANERERQSEMGGVLCARIQYASKINRLSIPNCSCNLRRPTTVTTCIFALSSYQKDNYLSSAVRNRNKYMSYSRRNIFHKEIINVLTYLFTYTTAQLVNAVLASSTRSTTVFSVQVEHFQQFTSSWLISFTIPFSLGVPTFLIPWTAYLLEH